VTLVTDKWTGPWRLAHFSFLHGRERWLPNRAVPLHNALPPIAEGIWSRPGAALGPIAAQKEDRAYLTGSVPKPDVEFPLAAPAA
jgi:hypothetical protein